MKYTINIETNGNKFPNVLRELADYLDALDEIPTKEIFINTLEGFDLCEPALVRVAHE